MNRFVEIILSQDDAVRNQSLASVCEGLDLRELLAAAAELDNFRRRADNLYQQVRGLFFLAAIYRYHVPAKLTSQPAGLIPFAGYQHLLQRRFSEAIDAFLVAQQQSGVTDASASALAEAYHRLGFQTLADQVRRSVRSFRGNQWMFRIGHPFDYPLRIVPELLDLDPATASPPLLRETTAVRMDFSHSAWSDIFFLGMDYPEAARVLNVSVDLAVRGRDTEPQPPIETYFRVIDQPLIRLVSVDLAASTELTEISDVFDFGRDHLGLLKAAVIASGIVPPGLEGCGQPLSSLLKRLMGPGRGFELVSKINDIPKGSRLAVSTNLLGSLISVCMRATGQVGTLRGPLAEQDRRTVAARAILGEWLGGSGGGWQDSGGVWPGIKLIQGATAGTGDPEFGISRGQLMPVHQVFSHQEVSLETRQALQDSLVMVHGGMAQNVGPILEMVTEHYLLRNESQWRARHEAIEILDEVVAALKAGDVRRIGQLTTRNFQGPLQQIIPWATNRFTDAMIEQCQQAYGDQFWGFWMLGGMSGGGMGFIFDPQVKPAASQWLATAMVETKRELEAALPFAMDPVVYDFAINDAGTSCELLRGEEAQMPDRYYAQLLPGWLQQGTRNLSLGIRGDLEKLGQRCQEAASAGVARRLVDALLPRPNRGDAAEHSLTELLDANGFDRQQHEQIRADLRAGRIGLAQNRLPSSTLIEDVLDEDLIDARRQPDQEIRRSGEAAIAAGQVAVVSLAAGVGSRWTEGAGVCKALHPFCRFAGRHRSFLEVHLAKTRRVARRYQTRIPHIFTTGYMTDEPIRASLERHDQFGFGDALYVSPGRSVGLRTVPTIRDLRFAWEEMPQQMLDEQQQKVRESGRAALLNWARTSGEASDYTDNVPLQCMHPVGHWYELPNLLRNGTLAKLLDDQPQLTTLLLHNIDTLGAAIDPDLLGLHLRSGSTLSFEVISRRLEDRGGGLARINGRARLVEGLAMPDEQSEFRLRYYNSMSTWIDIDALLAVFQLERSQLHQVELVAAAVRRMARRVPTYITLKEVKKRWGHGQEDIFPVAQFEKLWGDMSALPDVASSYLVTDVVRGQQLKQQAQLDGWLRDGSAEYVDGLCDWT
ncbi:UTP--glucose-1-phosphate uridylyltransferase [Planctomycetaceae bacterium SH139]